jgi:hypothetical protein
VNSLTFEDNSILLIAAQHSGEANSITANSVSIGNNVVVGLHRDEEDGGTGTLSEGRHVILTSTTAITGAGGAFSEVINEPGFGTGAINLAMPMLNASLDQSSNEVALNVSLKSDGADTVPGVSAPTKSLIHAIAASGNEELRGALLTSTTNELVNFSEDMDSARGSITAASTLAVDVTGPMVMTRLDSLSSGHGAASMPTFLPMVAGITGQGAFSPADMQSMGFSRALQGDPIVYAQGGSSEVTHGMWVRPVFWYAKTEKDEDAPASEVTGLGFVTGYDFSVGPATLGVSYGYSNASLDMRRVDGDMASHTVGMYGSLKLPEEVLFKAWGGHTWNRYDIDRSSRGLNNLAGGKYNRDSDGSTWTAAGQISRPFAITEQVAITPLAGLNAAWIREDGFTEHARDNASQALAVQYDKYSDTTVYSLLGAEIAYTGETGGVHARAGWNSRLAGDKRASREYRLQGVSWEDSLGSSMDNNTATVGLAGWYNIPNTNSLSLYGGYDANLGNRTQTHTLTAGLRLEF